jgi:hypothetical protein
MKNLNEHLCKILADKLIKRRLVTWYDPHRDFEPFVKELRGDAPAGECRLEEVRLSGQKVTLCVGGESFYEVKFAVEPMVSGTDPEPLILYLPGRVRDDDTSVLMEIELAGEIWEPQFKREARRVLKTRYGDGQIDQFLKSDRVNYQDIEKLMEGDGGANGGSGGSLMDLIFPESRGNNAGLVAGWLVNALKDGEIQAKGAKPELLQLLGSRLGFELPDNCELNDARRKVSRYVLLAEFRNDLAGKPPEQLELVVQPKGKHLDLVIEVAQRLRLNHADAYVNLADEVEQSLHLAQCGIAPGRLGKIDTFRFEEQILLDHVGSLILNNRHEDALEVIKHRRTSFWALHQLERQEQWQAYGYAAELCQAVDQIGRQLPDSKKTPVHWVEGYVEENGWYRADQLQRRLETTLANMAGTIASEKVVHKARNDYDQLVGRMTSGFIAAYAASDWTIRGVMHQTEVYSKVVQSPSERVCYILVDALRYEMGVELMGLLNSAEKLSIQPALGAIPTITPVGMAALMPGAESSFSVVSCGQELGSRIEDSVMAGLTERKKVWKGRVADVVDMELDKVLSQSPALLQKKLDGAPVVVVRSLDIDAMGESGSTLLARQVMDTTINNVARAIKRLSAIGLSKFVIAADHGHLFMQERDESERIEKPGGEQVSQHRRCWAGRGGSTPVSTVRVSATQLGYDSNLDFVFPTNNSVFKAGGDLAYYHGGLSLQELLVPVLSVQMPVAVTKPLIEVKVTLFKVPAEIHNRIVTFGIKTEQSLLEEEIVIMPVLISQNGQHVGQVGMVMDAVHDVATHCVKIKSGSSCNVGIRLLREDIQTVQILIQAPDTDQILVKSDKIPVKFGI